MASLTIRNLEEAVKSRLRVRAASRGRSMEDEARHILRAALSTASPRSPGLGESIRKRFAALGDVQLPIASREAVREPALETTTSGSGTQRTSKPARAARARRVG